MSDLTVNSGDVALHVEDTGGTGRPVVLIHGWPLSGKSWKDQISALTAAGHRVITYDRRGFGESDKPTLGFTYDVLSTDLQAILEQLDLRDVTLVGFSMGGGEVARYVSKFGEERLHSVVFAAAVPPFLIKSDDNPDGPLTEDAAAEMENGLKADRDSFFEGFVTDFFSVDGELKVDDTQKQEAIALSKQSDQAAALGCMEAFGTTDFREDLPRITVPTLVIHGDSDGVVPFEGSGKRTHEAIPQSTLVVVKDAPHGFNVSHADEFNAALVDFLKV